VSKKVDATKKVELPKKTEKTPDKALEKTPKEEEVKPEKTEKPEKVAKPERKKKKEKGIFALYKTETDKVVRLRPTCERCGTGYFMADHGNRYTCGHCGFTRYKPAENGHV
jgi:small subunit ribosomal protein S27Ae